MCGKPPHIAPMMMSMVFQSISAMCVPPFPHYSARQFDDETPGAQRTETVVLASPEATKGLANTRCP